MSHELWSIAHLHPDRAPDVCRLFENVFGTPMPLDFWRWKYADGRGRAVVALDKSGEIVGHYGGLPRQVSYFGDAQVAVQIADVMVAPEVRGVLTRSGPFAMTTGAFLDQFIGFGAEYLVGFGFPSERHLRIAHKLNLYESVDSVSDVFWPADTFSVGPNVKTQMAAIDWSLSTTAPQLDRLWISMQESVQDYIVPVRNANWWRHRFANHPSLVYRCFWLCNQGSQEAIGAFVVKPNIDGSGCWELMDWIGSAELIYPVIEQARRLAQLEFSSLRGWFSSSIVTKLAETGCTVTDIGVRVPTSIRRPGPSVAEVSGRWWLTGGDTDFR